MRHACVLVAVVAAIVSGGCAMVGSMPDDVKTIAGTWRGWIVGERDFTPATLAIHPDGTFEMSGPRLGVARSVSGTVLPRDGRLRLEGGGWRGTVIVSGATTHRKLTIERDDRLYTGRFAEESR